MERYYIGPHDEVQVNLPSGPILTVKRGDAIQINGDDAKALDEQPDNWAKTEKAAKKAESATHEPPSEPAAAPENQES